MPTESFEIAGALHFDEPAPGITRAVISTPLAEAEVYLQGAHVARWQPRGQDPVLFMSSKSLFAPGKAIRGGVPVIFPWFGARSDGKPGPAHGFARTMPWAVESTSLTSSGEVELTLVLTPDDCEARFQVVIGASLRMSLEVRNLSSAPFTYEEALHSYFIVSDVHQTSVTGLAGTTLIDKTDGLQRKLQSAEPVTFTKETDQVHVNTPATCVIHDPVTGRSINVGKTGSLSTIVWNPWSAKAASMADMGTGEWEHFVCVESGNAADNAVTLAPGGSHTLTTFISLQR
jgi:glucose-6-phosphate 1-epimerase